MQSLDFVNVGFGNYIKGEKIVAMLPMEQSVSKVLYKEAKEKGLMTTVARGRKLKTLILLDDNRIFMSAFSPEAIMDFIEKKIGLLEGEKEEREKWEAKIKRNSLSNKRTRGIEE